MNGNTYTHKFDTLQKYKKAEKRSNDYKSNNYIPKKRSQINVKLCSLLRSVVKGTYPESLSREPEFSSQH